MKRCFSSWALGLFVAVACALPARAELRKVDLSRVAIRAESVRTEASRLAVQELRYHLGLLSQTTFVDDAPFVFVFGRPADAPVAKPFESCYRIDGDKVWFWGDGNGTLFAVEGFLQRELGFRWIWPGESGIVYEPRTVVDLPTRTEFRHEAKLMMAELRNGHQTKLRYDSDEVRSFIPQVSPVFFTETKPDFDRIYEETKLWQKRLRIEPREQVRYGHAFTTWHKKYAKKHPEYLALVGGERGKVVERPDFVHLCVSNEATVDQIISDWLARGTNRFLNVCENDGGGYCECDGCRRYDVPRPEDGKIAHKTDRYVQFWNRIAKKAVAIRPDVMLIAYLYSEYRLPPRRERIAYPDNILCGAVPSPMDDTEGLFGGWCAAGLRHFFLRPNHHHYLGEIHRGFEKRLYEEFHNCLKMGLVGADYDANRVRPPQAPEFYVAARMMVEPDTSFEMIMDEYCDGYGAAKAEVRAFFRAVHETADRARREFAAAGMRLGPSQLSIDGGTVTLQSYGRNESELTEKRDILVRALAAHPELDARSKARLENLILQCEHAIKTFRFIEGASLDLSEFRRRADELLDFRLKHRTDLPDDYPCVFRKWWGEIQTWKVLRWPPKKAKASDRGLDG